MVHTSVLDVRIEHGFPEMQIAIHPNDGLDLDLITREHSVFIFTGSSLDKFKEGKGLVGEGELHLLNECPNGVLQVSEKISLQLAGSDKAMIILENKKILLAYK
ncbi:MAG: hypothetical protein PQJ58_20115 [Spirochaetales bacterium]|nr:hypothetical protein [Spirochaetales bacterium]